MSLMKMMIIHSKKLHGHEPPTLSSEQLKQKLDTLVNSDLSHIHKRVDDIDSNPIWRDMQIF